MKILLFSMLFSIVGIIAQENAIRNVPPSLLECFNTTGIMSKEDRLPHNIQSLIAIIRKVENTVGLNMDLRTLSVALLHRFRQDGIERNPAVQIQDGIVPVSPSGLSFFRFAKTLEIVQGSAISFPNNSLTAIERCTLHFMLSSSFERMERGDENTVCNAISQSAQYRLQRSIDEEVATESDNIKDDVETLSPQELELIKHKTEEHQPKLTTDDPNWAYPALPPNHPNSARLVTAVKTSTCPVENGVIRTEWGAVSPGIVLAAIAAALQPETVSLAELMRDNLDTDLQERGYTSGLSLSNRWLATLAGDLAEVALVQGPIQGKTIKVGATGNFNSSALPRWYFLSTTEDLEMTNAEIRGGLDGLILADSVASWYSRVSSLRLSQILDMYYSSRGVFNSTMRACNRRFLFTTVAPTATMVDQAYSAAVYLTAPIAQVHIDPAIVRNFATLATNALVNYIPTSMNDLSCPSDLLNESFNSISTHLTIILDTTWPFGAVQPFLAALFEGIDVGMYNSNFTLINGYDGSLIINSTNTLLDFYNFNLTQYNNYIPGFDLSKALVALRNLQIERLDNERRRNVGGGSSDIVLIFAYSTVISDSDRAFCAEQLKTMREQVPDATFLYLTLGSRDRWSSLAVNSATDTFAITSIDTGTNHSQSVDPVISRIRSIPKRLINSACGASYSSSGSTVSFVDYVQPSGINYYRLHPNYFSSDTVTVKVQGSGWGLLNVCSSRTVSRPNASAIADVSCTPVTTNTSSISFSCGSASVISTCEPFYLSVAANASESASYPCTDPNVCRYPDMRQYTISYDNLICRSSASAFFLAPFILVASFVFNVLH